HIGAISSLIILDIFVVGIVAFFAFNGYRRGGFKAFLSLLLLFIVVVITLSLYERPAMFLQVSLEASSSIAKVACFSIIFIILYTASRFVFHLFSKLASDIIVRGSIDGILGAIFGMAEAIFFMSIIFMNIAFYPVKPPLSDSLSFRLLKDIPGDVKGAFFWFLPKEKENQNQNSLIDVNSISGLNVHAFVKIVKMDAEFYKISEKPYFVMYMDFYA
ncbi:MAG: CvpA family protein, partial [Candidatus Poribacteria bacterium]